MRIWLLRLVPDIPYGRLITGFVILFGLFVWFVLAGLFVGLRNEVSPAAAVFFCVILAYIVPVFHFITERTLRAFDEVAPHLEADAETIEAWRRTITHKPWRWTLLNLALGCAAWIAHSALLLNSPFGMLGALLGSAGTFAIVAGPGLVWIVMMCAIGALVDNARLFRELARHVHIDLLAPAHLTAFGRVAASSTLALIGAQAAFPIMWLDPRVEAVASVPGILVTGAAMVFLFVRPIWPIHDAIGAAKSREIERINSLLAIARQGADGSSAPAMERLNPYLVYRREIAEVREWPFDTSIVTRLGFYLVIPPLTWVGAALIEMAVDSLL